MDFPLVSGFGRRQSAGRYASVYWPTLGGS